MEARLDTAEARRTLVVRDDDEEESALEDDTRTIDEVIDEVVLDTASQLLCNAADGPTTCASNATGEKPITTLNIYVVEQVLAGRNPTGGVWLNAVEPALSTRLSGDDWLQV